MNREPPLTREAFIASFAEHSHITPEQLLKVRTVEPCPQSDCDYAGCRGWRAVPKNLTLEEYRRALES